MVREVFLKYRRIRSGNGTLFEPFEAGYVNTYLLQAGRVGGLAIMKCSTIPEELTARMFGGYINFTSHCK